MTKGVLISRGLLLVGLALGAGLATSSPAEAASAKLVTVTLRVTHRVGPTGSWQTSRVGTTLPAGSRVRTAKRSKCEIKFPDGSRVRMGPRSDLVITDPDQKKLRVVTGQIFANIVSGTGAQIQGATATAAVRGTWVLFQGPTAPGVFPPWDFDWIQTWFGSCQFWNVQGSQTVGHGQQSGAPGGQGPWSPGLGFHYAFGNGTLYPWWHAWKSGVSTSATPGTNTGTQFKNQNVSPRTTTVQFVQPPTTGRLGVIVESASPVHPTGGSLLPALGLLPLSSLGQMDLEAKLGKAFYGPSSQLDLVNLLYDGGGFSGGRARASVLYDHLYAEIGLQAFTDYHGNWDTSISDLFLVDRMGNTDLTLGRQRYLEGPVNNSGLGTLFGALHFDGISLQHKGDRWSLSGAWIDDFEAWGNPPERTGGALSRVSTPFQGGQLGLNALYQRHEGWGFSADVSLPVVPGYLDLYTELGCDPQGRHLETFGAYFPELYQSAGVDLFVEYAAREDFPFTWSALAYVEAGDGWSGLAGARRAQGQDWEFALGAVKRFGSLSF